MQFNHKTKEELQQERIIRMLPKGRYRAYISSVVERKSSKQHDMLEMHFDIINPTTHKQHQITSWITSEMMDKLYSLAVALNIMDRYEEDKIVPFDIADKWCVVEIVISPAREGYQPTNSIIDYFPIGEAPDVEKEAF